MGRFGVPGVQVNEVTAAAAQAAGDETQKFRTAARLALVAMSAVYHKKELKLSLADQLDVVKTIDSNKTLLEQAEEQGNFNLKKFYPVAYQTIEEVVQQHGVSFDGAQVLEIPKDGSVLLSRHISLCRFKESAAGVVPRVKLDIYTGDSGSGKTTTAISTAHERHLACVYVTVSKETFGDETLGRAASKEERNALVVEGLKALLSSDVRIRQVSKRSTGGVAVVIDELGGFPLLLRSLCANYESLAAMLREVLWAPHVEIYACGTGCDSNTNRPGSSVATFNIVDMSSKERQDRFFEQTILGFLPTSLKDFLDTPRLDVVSAADAATISSLRALLKNRRVAAAFCDAANTLLTPAGGLSDQSARIQWRYLALHLANTAVLRFKSLNGLRSVDFGSPLNSLLSRALAYSLGGALQKMPRDDEERLIQCCGLVTDRARRFSSATSSQMGTVIPEAISDEGCEGTLALPRGVAHRYVISAAQLEMFRMGFGVAPRPRSGAGFEHTVCDFLMVLLCAQSAKIDIAPLPNDPLGYVKNQIKEACVSLTLEVVVSLQLKEQVKKVEDFSTEVALAIRKAVGGHTTRSSAIHFAAVVLNGPMAAAADLFLTIGTYHFARGTVCPSFSLPIQCKHFDCSTLTECQIGSEWYKCGSRCRPACLAEIATRIQRLDDVAKTTREVLTGAAVNAEELATAANQLQEAITLNTAAIFSGGVRRGTLLKVLQEKVGREALLPNVSVDCADALLICLSKTAVNVPPMRGFANLTTVAADGVLRAAEVLHPVVQGELAAAMKVGDWSSVVLTRNPC
jgi:hypothetical protein